VAGSGHTGKCPAVYILKVTQQSRGQQRYGGDADWGCPWQGAHRRHLANTTERRCGFMSNYFDHLFILKIHVHWSPSKQS